MNADLWSNGDGLADPIVLDKTFLAPGIDNEIRPKAARLKPASRIQLAQPVESGGGEDVQHREVEECTCKRCFVCDDIGTPRLLPIRPILLELRLFWWRFQ